MFINETFNSQASFTSFDATSLIMENCIIHELRISELFPNLMFLSISMNIIHHVNQLFPQMMQNLQSFIVSNNSIDINEGNVLLKMRNLQYLDISSTKTHRLSKVNFEFLSKLETLKMTDCNIRTIDYNVFENLVNLNYLHLNNTKMPTENVQFIIVGLKKLEKVFNNYFKTCCFAWKYHSSSILCLPETSLFNSCSDLISSFVLRGVIWIIALLGIIGNVSSITFRIVMNRKSVPISYIALSIADLLTGLYILIVACSDIHFRGRYIENEEKWTKSVYCKSLGIICSFSVLLSTGSLLLITVERHKAIMNPFKSKLNKRFSLMILLLISLVSLTLSILPVFIFEVC